MSEQFLLHERRGSTVILTFNRPTKQNAFGLAALDEIDTTLAALARSYQVIVITKGDLLDQERKIAQSGLGDLLHGAEIVSDKTAAVYSAILTRYGHRPETCMMVGNSLRSDVLPALAAGAFGVHVPAPRTWEMERADAPQYAPRYHAIEDLGALQDLIDLITDHNH